LNQNISGVFAASTSEPDFPYGTLTAEQIDAMTLEEIEAEMERLRASLAAGPRLRDLAIDAECIKAGTPEPTIMELEFAVAAVLQHAAADPVICEAIVRDFTVAGLEDDAAEFAKAVAGVSAR
jgi:hypothetical protein